MNIWNKKKKPIIIAAVCVAAAALGVICAALLVPAVKKAMANAPISSNTESVVSFVSEAESVVEPVVEVDNGIKLVLNSPARNNITVTEPKIIFSGTSDPERPLTVNGNTVERDENGGFALRWR